MSNPPKLSRETWEQLRDWLVPETTHPGESEFWPDADVEREWQYAQHLRALLTAEADRAEQGDHD